MTLDRYSLAELGYFVKIEAKRNDKILQEQTVIEQRKKVNEYKKYKGEQ